MTKDAVHDTNRIDFTLPGLDRTVLELEFSRRILATEKWRAHILFLLSLGVLGLHLLASNFGPVAELIREEVQPVYQMSALIIAGAAGFELFCSWVCGRFMVAKKVPPMWLRYLNALVETSFPTLGLLAAMQHQVSFSALNSPVVSAYYFFILLATLRLDFSIALFTGLVASFGYASVFLYVHAVTNLWPDTSQALSVGIRMIFLVACGALSGMVGRHIRLNLLKSVQAVGENREITEIFSQLVSPTVAHEILTRGVKSEVREVTILVVDIRNFTALAEFTPPDDLVHYLNTIWSAGVKVVHNHGGVINKFLGDGFMAVFGAPIPDENHAEKAVWAGLNLLGEMSKLQSSHAIPETRLGIGIHSGPALLGIVGGETRREYTVIGDTVNVAFRIEQLNKEFDSQLLISEAVKRGCGEITRDAELLSHMAVRGRTGTVQVCRVV